MAGMPWTVQIEDERGNAPGYCGATIEFSFVFSMPEFNLLPHVVTSCLLKYLDPWGDTVFSRRQMNDLQREWSSLAVPENESQKGEWDRVLQMIDICSSSPHLYLRFFGD
jgi:hypothetical protein